MRSTIRSVAILAGIALSLACGVAGGAGRPSFDEVAATGPHNDIWSTDPCGSHRHMVGVCRLLRPVHG